MSPGVSGMGNVSSDIWFTGRAAQSNVWFGVLSQLRHTRQRCGLLFRALPRSLRTVEMDSLRRPIVTLSDSFNLCQSVMSDKGTRSDKRLRMVTAMLRQVFCGAQGATHAFVTTATMLADAFDESPGPLSFVACGDGRTPSRVRDFRFQHRCKDNLVDALRAYANSQNGDWISADSVSRIALWKVWFVH